MADPVAVIKRRTPTSTDARCSLCPGVMILWQDRTFHTTHLNQTVIVADGGKP